MSLIMMTMSCPSSRTCPTNLPGPSWVTENVPEIRPASEIVQSKLPSHRNSGSSESVMKNVPDQLPANGLTSAAASAVAEPTSSTAAAPAAASAIHPASVHRVIDRVIVHL